MHNDTCIYLYIDIVHKFQRPATRIWWEDFCMNGLIPRKIYRKLETMFPLTKSGMSLIETGSI